MRRRAFLTGLAALFCFPKPIKANPEFDTHIGFRYVISYRNQELSKGTLFVPKKGINSPREYALEHFEEILHANPNDISSVMLYET